MRFDTEIKVDILRLVYPVRVLLLFLACYEMVYFAICVSR